MEKFQNTEGQNETGENEAEKTAQIEREFEKFLGKAKKCFRRWALIGAGVGALVAGEAGFERHIKDSAWQDHLQSVLTAKDFEIKKGNEIAIAEIFGDGVNADISAADKAGLFARNQERSMPQFEGFGPDEERIKKYSITEDYNMYPKKWLTGKLESIKYISDAQAIEKETQKQGEVERLQGSKPVMYLYPTGRVNQSNPIGYVSSFTISHELGHANDWRMDIDVNILDRQELLLGVHRRMVSDNHYDNEGEFHYHETYLDGTKEGLYKACKEYWADICGEYFSNPKRLREQFSEDFDLVNKFVLKHDPHFDIFADRGAFDPHTGKLKEVKK